MDKKLKIIFAPGCFDGFEGSQEELDALVKEITEMMQSEEFLENSQRIDIEELYDENPDLAEKIVRSFEQDQKRNLN